MKEELFISEDLRTLQNKIKNDKSAEGLVQRAGGNMGFPKIQLPHPQVPPMKTAEKLLAEKASEKLLAEKMAEKTAEKLLAEKQAEAQISPEAWQNMFGVIRPHNDDNRLF